MLSAILLILKILGIILLVILGILLLVLFMVLCIPIRYRGKLSYHDSLDFKLDVSWLLHIINAHYIYGDEPAFTVRVFKFAIYPKKNKPEAEAEEDTEDFKETEYKAPEKPKAKTLEKPKIEEKDIPKPKSKPEPKAKPKQEKVKKPSIIQRIKFKLKAICDKIKAISEKKDKIVAALQNKKYINLVNFLFRKIIRLLKHILPRKIKGKVVFGFDDPYTTGQVLSYIALFYGLYQNKVEVVPMFDKSIIEADTEFKGHIRAIHILVTGLIIWFNKDFKEVYKKFKSA